MVNQSDLCGVDELILQVFEQQEDQFYFPVSTQKEARAFVKALHVKGVPYQSIGQEVGEFEHSFGAWRKGLGRPGIGNRIIERINKPLQLLLLSDGEDSDGDDDVVDESGGKARQKKKLSEIRGQRSNKGETSLQKVLREEGLPGSVAVGSGRITQSAVHSGKSKDLESSWMSQIDKKVNRDGQNGKAEINGKGGHDGMPVKSRTKAFEESETRAENGNTRIESPTEKQSESKDKHHQLTDENAECAVTELAHKSPIGSQQGDSKKESVEVKSSGKVKCEKADKVIIAEKVETIKERDDNKILREKGNANIAEGYDVESQGAELRGKVEEQEVAREEVKVNAEAVAKRKFEVCSEDEEVPKGKVKPPAILISPSISSGGMDADRSRSCSSEKQASVNRTSEISYEPDDKRISSLDEDQDFDALERELDDDKRGSMFASGRKPDEISAQPPRCAPLVTADLLDFDDMTGSESMDGYKEQSLSTTSATDSPSGSDAEEEDGAEDGGDEATAGENYDSDLDVDNNNSGGGPDLTALLLQIHALKEQSRDGPGYLYVLTDGPVGSKVQRVKIGASRCPNKRLKQAGRFNVDMELVTAVGTSMRATALHKVCKLLEIYALDDHDGWFEAPLPHILDTVSKIAAKYARETSDC